MAMLTNLTASIRKEVCNRSHQPLRSFTTKEQKRGAPSEQLKFIPAMIIQSCFLLAVQTIKGLFFPYRRL